MRHSLCESQVTVSVQLLPDWVIPTSSFWYMGIAVPPNPLWVPVRVHMCSRSRGWLWGIQPHRNVAGNKWLVKGRESERRFLMMGGVCWEEERVPEIAFPHFCYSPKCSIIIKCAFYWAFKPWLWRKMERTEMCIDLAHRHRQQPSLWDCPWPNSSPSMQSAASRWLLVTDIK